MASTEPGQERPLFVFGGGWRTGSTLVQRLLCAQPGVLVWGESRGLVESLREAWRTTEALQRLSAQHRANLDAEGDTRPGWIAVANPPFDRFREALRELFLAYLARPAAEQGRPRWGFKEVRCDAGAARWLLELFPEARFVFLVRDPAACLASARGTTRDGSGLLPEVGGPRAFLAHWTRLTRSFAEEAHTLPAHLLRYEDLVTRPAETCRALAEALDLDPTGFDPALLAEKVRGWGREPHLLAQDRRALRSAELRRVAAALGYGPGPGRTAALLGRLRGAAGGRPPPSAPGAPLPARPRRGDA